MKDRITFCLGEGKQNVIISPSCKFFQSHYADPKDTWLPVLGSWALSICPADSRSDKLHQPHTPCTTHTHQITAIWNQVRSYAHKKASFLCRVSDLGSTQQKARSWCMCQEAAFSSEFPNFEVLRSLINVLERSTT